MESFDLHIPSSVDSFSIPIKIRQPQHNLNSSSQSLKSIIFFIHGGIFTHGSQDCHPSIALALSSSSSNIDNVVITASFRCGRSAPWKSGITMNDLKDVVGWIEKEKETREEWRGLPVGLAGSSSGGFFALTLAQSLPPNSTAFCILICPVSDPYKRASYLKSCIARSAVKDGFVSDSNDAHSPTKAESILETQMGFWEDYDVMQQAGKALSSTSCHGTNGTPTLLIIGSKDKNVPFEVTKGIQSWATRTIVVGGRGHEICDSVEEICGRYDDYIPEVMRFLDYVLCERKNDTNNLN